MELVAVPWADVTSNPQDIINEITQVFKLDQVGDAYVAKQHGRKLWQLSISGDVYFIEISFMPTLDEVRKESTPIIMNSRFGLNLLAEQLERKLPNARVKKYTDPENSYIYLEVRQDSKKIIIQHSLRFGFGVTHQEPELAGPEMAPDEIFQSVSDVYDRVVNLVEQKDLTK
jgi:gamma-glutamylcyclotransferase (GGCT)/AIG2-like uncharacterized protein YtfP